MFSIQISSKKPKEMRYCTAGDYYELKDGTVCFDIVETKNWKYMALIAIHELVEYFLVKANGITLKSIDDFDMQFEQERKMGIHGDHDEPGDSLEAPYHAPHSIATGIERICAVILRVHWAEYSNIVDTLAFGGPSKKQGGSKRR